MKKIHRIAASVAVALMSATVLSGCENSTGSAEVIQAGSYQATEHGLLVLPAQGQAKAVAYKYFVRESSASRRCHTTISVGLQRA